MQHHGAPTRLLDWTVSPYVALYFAVEEDWEVDGALWAFHSYPLAAAALAYFETLTDGKGIDPLAADAGLFLRLYLPQRPSGRMVAQQGLFTVCNNIQGNHQEHIEKVLAGVSDGEYVQFLKLIIPKELKPAFMIQLRGMNVTAATLFPGVDGLGRTVREQARLVKRFKVVDAESVAASGESLPPSLK